VDFLTGITNLTNWFGNVIMPTLAGLFFVIAVLRFSRNAPFQYSMYAGFTALMVSGTLGRIKADSITSSIKIRSIESVPGMPWVYQVFAAKEIHRLSSQRIEQTEKMVCRYQVRLVFGGRSQVHPIGLLVGEFWEQQMIAKETSAWSRRALYWTVRGRRSVPRFPTGSSTGIVAVAFVAHPQKLPESTTRVLVGLISP